MKTAEVPFVCKFGGTSVADADQIRKVAAIVRADPRRRFLVVSAPGKRHAADHKVTDLLYLCHHTIQAGLKASEAFALIRQRFEEISAALGVPDMRRWLDAVESEMGQGRSKDWVASRGEYLHARLIAAYLGATFVDAADCIRFSPEGRLDPNSYELTARALQGEGLFLLPGFYGVDASSQIKTFSRGGSDITGAIVARAVGACAYENWTDVDGLLMADPRLVENPRPIREVTYQELRELAYMGASVLHDEAIFPVREAHIPIHIRNTNAPEMPGTWIRTTRPNTDLPIVGIAGRTGFTTIQIEKALMNQERGFGRRLLEILEAHGISYEHTPSSIDSMSVVLRDEELDNRREGVLDELQRVLLPDRMEVLNGLALIATVGQGMSHRVGIAGRLFGALAAAGINVRLINQGASEINIIVGVASADYPAAVRAIYHAFVKDEG
ncbi:MAG TPA: aspartate kinase [Chthonomonadaceae bacterium]|nr:aspartate kinase [Chthonomonadaceae bacterium]